MPDEYIELLGGAMVGGSSVTLLVLGLLYITRGAFAAALKMAAEREGDAVRAGLARDLESYKHEFARELEEKRTATALELESFKAELTLAAETRRQLAARRVEALLEIVSLGEPLLRTELNHNPSSPQERADAHVALMKYFGRVRALSFLFEEATANALSDYASKLHAAAAAWHNGNDPEGPTRATAIYRDMLSLIRREIGVEVVAEPSTGRAAATDRSAEETARPSEG